MRGYEPYYTEDGSVGLYSYADKDVYHSKFGALTEAWEKFVLPSGLNKLINTKQNIKVLDICYGIGYNTKALMSYVIDKNKNEILYQSFFSKLFNIVSVHTNNLVKKIKSLLLHTDTVYDEKCIKMISKIDIDCLDINEELVKLSPLFKTIKTPGEIYSEIVPEIFSCFDAYNKFKKIFENILSPFYPHNRKYINDLLEIKFKTMHIDKEYKVNPIVNYILINILFNKYGKQYFDKDFKKSIKENGISKFISKSLIKYAKFNHFFGYNLSSSSFLSTCLHNIYYSTLSKRYNKVDFKQAESLFNINFFIEDARKSIKRINTQYDCIFLDAFTYTKAPQLWSSEFINALYEHLNENGVLLTYSTSAQIRNTLLENKFYVGKIYNDKTDKFIGTIASKNKSKILYPLNNYEIGLCNTKAGIPYHDPNMSFSNKEIMELREYEFNHSNLMSSSKYMKIRSMRGENE